MDRWLVSHKKGYFVEFESAITSGINIGEIHRESRYKYNEENVPRITTHNLSFYVFKNSHHGIVFKSIFSEF